jgi:DNA-binding response OmpR family regulator
MAKILVADDDRQVGEMVADWLKNENHIVELAVDGVDADERMAVSTYDLFILDWDMPRMTGVDLCRKFRLKGGTTPIIMLTAKTSLDEKEQGLDAGADDYISKPFQLRELSARIRAIFRRPALIQAKVLKMRGLEFDTTTRQLHRKVERIELLGRELSILEFLMLHPNQVFSLEALQARIWPSDSEASPEAIRVHVFRIRSKIEIDGEPAIIKTVHRQGYMFDAEEPSGK